MTRRLGEEVGDRRASQNQGRQRSRRLRGGSVVPGRRLAIRKKMEASSSTSSRSASCGATGSRGRATSRRQIANIRSLAAPRVLCAGLSSASPDQ